jgi:hypothetical protein
MMSAVFPGGDPAAKIVSVLEQLIDFLRRLRLPAMRTLKVQIKDGYFPRLI